MNRCKADPLDKNACMCPAIRVEDSDDEHCEPPKRLAALAFLPQTPETKKADVEGRASAEKVTHPRRRLSFSKIAEKVRGLQEVRKNSQSASASDDDGWSFEALQIGGRFLSKATRLDDSENDYFLNGPYECSEEEEEDQKKLLKNSSQPGEVKGLGLAQPADVEEPKLLPPGNGPEAADGVLRHRDQRKLRLSKQTSKDKKTGKAKKSKANKRRRILKARKGKKSKANKSKQTPKNRARGSKETPKKTEKTEKKTKKNAANPKAENGASERKKKPQLVSAEEQKALKEMLGFKSMFG